MRKQRGLAVLRRLVGSSALVILLAGRSQARQGSLRAFSEVLTASGASVSSVAILGQTMGMQNRKNMEARLAMADLVITPEVTMFKVLGFGNAEEIIARGEEKTRAHAAELARYALAEDAYRRHVDARPKLAPPSRVDMKGDMESLIHHFKLFTEGY